jgi:hypothetical protein
LCIETLSHFPHEEEIILPPKTMLRLDRRDDKRAYYHTDVNFSTQVKHRYEFTLVGKGEIKFEDKPRPDYETPPLRFDHLSKYSTMTLEEKVRHFMKSNVDTMDQFKVQIGSKVFTIMTSIYDSTGAYKQFYAVPTTNGFSMYTIYNNHVLFFIEIVEEKGLRRIYTNYYVQYSTIDRTKVVSDEDFITFLAYVANFFEVDHTVIFADYMTCDIFSTQLKLNVEEETKLVQRSFAQRSFSQRSFSDKGKPVKGEKEIDIAIVEGKIYGGSYCIEYYNYLKYGKKRYSDAKILNSELYPKFAYYQLDKLRKTTAYAILSKEDSDELYQIYNKVYTAMTDKSKHTIGDFFVWIVENKCYLVDTYVKKLEKLFKKENTLSKPYYMLDSPTFLYNRQLISEYPGHVLERSISIDVDGKSGEDTRVVARD